MITNSFLLALRIFGILMPFFFNSLLFLFFYFQRSSEDSIWFPHCSYCRTKYTVYSWFYKNSSLRNHQFNLIRLTMYLHIKPKDIMIMAPTIHIIKTTIIIVDTYPLDKYENSKYSNSAMDTTQWKQPIIETIATGLNLIPFSFFEVTSILILL